MTVPACRVVHRLRRYSLVWRRRELVRPGVAALRGESDDRSARADHEWPIEVVFQLKVSRHSQLMIDGRGQINGLDRV